MKTRILHTKIWKDKFFAELTPTEKLLFIYLLTNERVNIIHCYELTEREIQFDTGIDTPTIKGMKKKLEQADKIYFYEDWVYLRNATKYENYTGVKNERAKEKLEHEMSDCVKDWYFNIKNTPIDTPIDTPSIETINHKSEIINHKSETINKKQKNKRKEYKRFIEQFNELFDRNFRATDERFNKYKARKKTFSQKEILKALENLSKSPWHRGVNDRGWQADPDFLIRNDEQIDKWLNKDIEEAKELSKLSRKAKNGQSKITRSRL